MSEPSEQNSDVSTPAEPATPAATDAPQMPDGLPESFWDAESGQIKVDDLVGSYKELSTFKTEQESKFANRPESADKYELRVPEGFELPEGMSFEGSEDSALLKAAREITFAAGGDQAMFDGLVQAYLQDEINYQAAAQEIFAEEMKTLGETADARIEAVNTYLSANLPEDKAKALSAGITSAKALEAIEDLIKGRQDATVQTGGNPAPSGMSLDELKALQNDPRYYRDRDPEIVKKVQDGYQKLFPGKQQRIA